MHHIWLCNHTASSTEAGCDTEEMNRKPYSGHVRLSGCVCCHYSVTTATAQQWRQVGTHTVKTTHSIRLQQQQTTADSLITGRWFVHRVLHVTLRYKSTTLAVE